jgi:hypothetical protein
MPIKNYPKWLSWSLTILSVFNLAAYATQELILDKEVELYRYVLTFIFGLMFYNMANKKEE